MIAPDPAFGQVLLEQKPRWGDIGSMIFLIVMGLLMSLVVFAPAAGLYFRIVSVCFGGGLIALALVALWRRWMHVYLQQHGIREYRQRRGRSLPYEKVDAVTYSALRIFMHGSYIHTVEKLALKSNDAPGPPLVCTHIFKEPDPHSAGETRTPVLDVRNALCPALTVRLSRRLARENGLIWTPGLRIHTGGLEVLDTKAGAQVFEWRRLSRIAIEDGKLRIWVDADTRPRVDTSTTVPNFYPNYFLALQLRKQAVQPAV